MQADLMPNLLLKWQRNRSRPEIVITALWVISTVIDSNWRQLHHEMRERENVFNGIKDMITESLESANINFK